MIKEPMNQTEMDDMIDVMARRRLALKRLEVPFNFEAFFEFYITLILYRAR